jgi:alpha-galactosidase
MLIGQQTYLKNSFTFDFAVNITGMIHIPIVTQQTALVIRINSVQDPLVIYIGKRLQNKADYDSMSAFDIADNNNDYTGLYSSAYTPSGGRNLLEPAIQVIHADGNPSLELKYIRHEQTNKDQPNGATLTTIYLKDPMYPFEVNLYYKAYYDEDIIEQWTTIKHAENGVVRLEKYSSANLYLSSARAYYLTHFHGDWAREMEPAQIELTAGMKVLDTKLGTRADLFQAPSFFVSLNQLADHDNDDQGEIISGTLAWSGNYQIQFEIDPLKNLRLIAGINPYASEYSLKAGEEFVTPSFLFTYSSQGVGMASRNWHRWARKSRIPQGQSERLTLLNNWEATYFNFNEDNLTSLIKDGKKLGVDLFLLDDGWFGNKYPRNSDTAGLGDWQVNVKKLPHGIGYLINEADKSGIRFGIWLEPEMVNPKSELYENHPEWVIKAPNRAEYYFRNQLVLDLSNPLVQEFVYNTIDSMFVDNPRLAFIKWDCNAVIYNAYSSFNRQQSHLYIDYVRGLYNVTERVRRKYPTTPMMLCSGGGGRIDYGALQYFTEFWPSDNTDGVERVFIQWSYSFFFPVIATCNHVTSWGKQSLKFRTDVAMMGKLGYDIVVSKLDPDDLLFSQQALLIYDRLKDTIWHGDLFRLVSPYRVNSDIASLMFVDPTQKHAVWFTYLVNSRYRAGSSRLIRLKGLDPNKNYVIREINIYPGTSNSTIIQENRFSGDFLLNFGYDPMIDAQRPSVIVELTNGVQTISCFLDIISRRIIIVFYLMIFWLV